MQDKITHEGIIDQISNNKVYVRILNKSACAACHSKGVCSVSEMAEKIVEVHDSGATYAVGQTVIVALERTLGNKAVVLGYLVPFVILIVTLFISSSFLNELWSGLIAISILIPYYGLLYLFKDKLSKAFSFRIEHI